MASQSLPVQYMTMPLQAHDNIDEPGSVLSHNGNLSEPGSEPGSSPSVCSEGHASLLTAENWNDTPLDGAAIASMLNVQLQGALQSGLQVLSSQMQAMIADQMQQLGAQASMQAQHHTQAQLAALQVQMAVGTPGLGMYHGRKPRPGRRERHQNRGPRSGDHNGQDNLPSDTGGGPEVAPAAQSLHVDALEIGSQVTLPSGPDGSAGIGLVAASGPPITLGPTSSNAVFGIPSGYEAGSDDMLNEMFGMPQTNDPRDQSHFHDFPGQQSLLALASHEPASVSGPHILEPGPTEFEPEGEVRSPSSKDLFKAIEDCMDIEGEDEVLAILAHPSFEGINAVGRLGETALHQAAWKGLCKVVNTLLDRPDFTSVNTQTLKTRRTALHYAAINARDSVCKTLLCHPSVQSGQRDNDRMSALEWALQLQKEESESHPLLNMFGNKFDQTVEVLRRYGSWPREGWNM